MFTDEHRCNVWDRIHQRDLLAFAALLPWKRMEEAAERAGVALGKGPLHCGNMVWLGIACAWQTAQNFAGVLTFTLKLLEDMPSDAPTPLKPARRERLAGKKKRSKHDPRRDNPTEISEEAFAQARKRMPLEFWATLLVLLGEQFGADHGNLVRWKGFRLLAMDGTMIDLPNWPRLREHFGTANNGHGKHLPQARMVMLQFPLVRMPYRYELTPRREAEIVAAARLVAHLQRGDLLLMDRGFWSYPLFCQILSQRAHFGIRLRKGMKLKTVRCLDRSRKDRIVRWKVPTKHKNQGLPEWLDLRKIDYQIKGFRPSAIVTSVTNARRTTREDWVRLTTETEAGSRLGPGLYHRRWEIETTFCELKVRQGMEGNLRSRTPEGIAYEIAGHVLLYHLVRWLIVKAARAEGLDPLRVSFLNALRELVDMRQTLITASPRRVSQVLLPRLLKRIVQHLVPQRNGRHCPRPNDTKPKNKGNGRLQLPAKLSRNKA